MLCFGSNRTKTQHVITYLKSYSRYVGLGISSGTATKPVIGDAADSGCGKQVHFYASSNTSVSRPPILVGFAKTTVESTSGTKLYLRE